MGSWEDVSDLDFTAICREMVVQLPNRNSCSELGGRIYGQVYRKKPSNKVSICALDSTAMTFKELQKWKYMWGMYMDGYDGHVNVCPYSLPPLIWCCSCTSCEEKWLWETPSPITLVKILTPQFTVTGERPKEVDGLETDNASGKQLLHRNVSSAVQL